VDRPVGAANFDAAMAKSPESSPTGYAASKIWES
jgi:hypothetical protein